MIQDPHLAQLAQVALLVQEFLEIQVSQVFQVNLLDQNFQLDRHLLDFLLHQLHQLVQMFQGLPADLKVLQDHLILVRLIVLEDLEDQRLHFAQLVLMILLDQGVLEDQVDHLVQQDHYLQHFLEDQYRQCCQQDLVVQYFLLVQGFQLDQAHLLLQVVLHHPFQLVEDLHQLVLHLQ